jgi:hypothetical protein
MQVAVAEVQFILLVALLLVVLAAAELAAAMQPMRQQAQPTVAAVAVVVAIACLYGWQPQAAPVLSSSPCQPRSTLERQLAPQASRRRVSTQA